MIITVIIFKDGDYAVYVDKTAQEYKDTQEVVKMARYCDQLKAHYEIRT